MSWLGSTARKGKPQPARTYRNRAGKMAVHRAAGTESEASQSDRDEPIRVIHKVMQHWNMPTLLHAHVRLLIPTLLHSKGMVP